MIRFLSRSGVAVLGFVLIASAHLEVRAEVGIDSNDDAAVFVKVRRLANQQEVTGFGNAFVVHENGFLVASSATVAQTIQDHTAEKTRTIRSDVLGVTVVVNSGTDEEIELPARVLVEEPRAGLALLKVSHVFGSQLEVSRIESPQIEDEVTIVACPFGERTGGGRWFNPASDVNPKTQTNTGSITRLRRGRNGSVSVAETGIETTPGHLGAPVFDPDGDVIGVVVADNQGTALVIPTRTVRRFLEKCSYKVILNPPGINPDLNQMTVDIVPLLDDLEGISGTVAVEGRDLHRTYARLEATDFGYRATIKTNDRLPGIQPPKSYDAEIEIRMPGASRMSERRLRIPATDTQNVLKHPADAYKVDPDTHVPGDLSGLSNYAESLRSSLAEGGGESRFRRSPSGSLVIDQEAVSSVAGVSSEAFEDLESDEQKKLAARFEVIFNEFCSLTSEHMIPIPAHREGMSDGQYRRLIHQQIARVGADGVAAWADYLSTIAEEADSLTKKLRRMDVGKCSDGNWRVNKTGCETPGPDDCY